MSDESLGEVEEEAAREGTEAIEASLEAVDRWVRRFDRDMGAPSQKSQPAEERISETG